MGERAYEKNNDEEKRNRSGAEESTEGAQEELSYDSGAVTKSNIFASYPGDAM